VEVFSSHFGHDSGNLDGGISWIFSVSPVKYRNASSISLQQLPSKPFPIHQSPCRWAPYLQRRKITSHMDAAVT
jgi:hypothetical protein